MLSSRWVRSLRRQNSRLALLAIVVALGVACAEPEPRFGEPGGILDRKLPQEATGGDGADGPFTGTTAAAPAKTMRAAHAGGKGPEPADNIDCMTCHKNGANTLGAPSFSFGGRINENDAPVAGAEVMVVQGTEKLGPVKSDADGFFSSPGAAAVKDGAVSWVRKGTGGTDKRMGGTLQAAPGVGCNAATCHVDGKNGTTAKINL